MSSLFVEENVERVKLVLNKRDGSGSDIFYIGLDYYAEDGVHSGSSETWPVLASSPGCRRSVGRHISDLHSIDVAIYGKVALDGMHRTFYDLHEDYEFRNAEVTVYYHAKPTDDDAATVVANTRQTLECTKSDWNATTGILTLTCVDTFFPETPIHKYLDADIFTNMQKDWQDEIGAIVFGENVVINAPVTKTGANFIEIFAGFEFNGHQISSVGAVYDKNTFSDLSSLKWLEIDNSPKDPIVGPGISPLWTGSAKWNLQEGAVGSRFSLTTATKLASFTTNLAKYGSPTSAEGSLTISLYRATELESSATWEPYDSVIETVSIDPASVISGNRGDSIVSARTLPPGDYLAILKWSNRNDTTNYFGCDYAATAGYRTYRQDFTEHDQGWERWTTRRLGLDVNAFEIGSITHYTTGVRHATQSLDAQGAIMAFGGTSANQQMKVKVDGLKDDASGTYTGTASALIKNPADVIRFVLQYANMVGLSSSKLDTSTFSSVRSSLSSAGINLSFAVDRETYALELITDICEQSRVQFYRTRSGLLALRYPTYSNTVAHTFNQTQMRADLHLLGAIDNDESSVINSFSYLHTPNLLELPQDPAVQRRVKNDKYSGHVYLNADESSDSDTTRERDMSDSESLYGRYTHSLQICDKLATAAAVEKLRDYNADRFSTLQKRVEYRVPRRNWYNNADMFDILKVEHPGLPASNKTHSDDDAADQAYSDGLPVVSASHGSIWGECVEVYESGEWMTFIVETVSRY